MTCQECSNPFVKDSHSVHVLQAFRLGIQASPKLLFLFFFMFFHCFRHHSFCFVISFFSTVFSLNLFFLDLRFFLYLFCFLFCSCCYVFRFFSISCLSLSSLSLSPFSVSLSPFCPSLSHFALLPSLSLSSYSSRVSCSPSSFLCLHRLFLFLLFVHSSFTSFFLNSFFTILGNPLCIWICHFFLYLSSVKKHMK